MGFNPNVNMPSEVNQLSSPKKGVVINNKDKALLGRIQCKIEGVAESPDMESLVWVAPGGGQCGRGKRGDVGSFSVPDINSVVQVTFPNGDVYTPQYGAHTDEITDGQIAKIFAEDYPNTQGTIEPDGSWTRENQKQGYKESYHRSGYYFKVDKEGSLVIDIPKSVTIRIGGQLCIQVQDLIAIHGKNNIGITADQKFGIHSSAVMNIDGDGRIHLNSGDTSTADSAKSVCESAVSNLQNRITEVQKLRRFLKEKGTAHKQSLNDYSKAMKGTKKE